MNELIQEIITYLIISSTTVYTLYKIVLFFTPSQNKSACSGCFGGNCGIKHNNVSTAKLYTSIQKKKLFLDV
ncbi:MAG: hypothetical protein DRI95_12975 [Bacteroidetes bacterium]|nr:MAG: hypothetical protein DRI95_12975 [Bacteroidota bacterium]